MNEISADELYEGLLAHGLFSEKLPPFLTAQPFFDYCQGNNVSFPDKWRQYIYFESMRNINVPRPLGIPNPMAYQSLCQCLADNWDKIQNHFADQTGNQDYKISRIHIRKMSKSKALFKMNYDDWRTDGNPEIDLAIGNHYLVRADISTCFPSIYTHSIAWALVKKAQAKSNSGSKFKSEWYNKIDHYTQNIKNGETHGLIIGPHASNLLSEIILTSIDNRLYHKDWRYTRNIDDYSAYVRTYEDGQKFLRKLGEELRNFDLSLNHKKTEIIELPVAPDDQWVHRLSFISFCKRNGQIDFAGTRAYLDLAIEQMSKNKMNSAILNYALKVLSGQKLTPNAKEYSIKTFFHLSIIFPYLIPLLEEYVFDKYSVSTEEISDLANLIYQQGLANRNFEAVSHAIYFSIKFDFSIKEIKPEAAIQSDSCIFILLTYKYFQKRGDKGALRAIKDHVLEFKSSDDDFNRNWLLFYEVLNQSDLPAEWKALKKSGVTFIKDGF